MDIEVHINLISWCIYGILFITETIKFCILKRKRGFFMTTRHFVFIEGEVITYNLASNKLATLLTFLSNTDSYHQVAENVYYVGNLECLRELYENFIISPTTGNNVAQYYFFSGDYEIRELDEEVLEHHLEKLQTEFSCNRLTPCVYKVYRL